MLYYFITIMRTCIECQEETDNFLRQDKKCRKCKNKYTKANLSHRYHNSRNSAKRRGYTFNLTKKEYKKITNSNCIYCNGTDGNEKYQYVGVDRVNNNEGYILGNVVPCCRICNSMKSNLSYYQFIIHIGKIFKNMIYKFI